MKNIRLNECNGLLAKCKGGALAVLSLGAMLAFPILALAGDSSSEKASSESPTRVIAAKVNGQPIYEDQLEPLVEQDMSKYRKRGIRGEQPELRRGLQAKALEQFIVAELFYQAGQKLDIPDIEKRIDEAMAKSQKQASDTKDADVMTSRNTVKRHIYIREYMEKNDLLAPQVPDKEIRAYYEKYKDSFASKKHRAHVEHILILLDGEAKPEEKEQARKKIEQVRKLILDGKPFAEVAKEYSEDANAMNGGDMGYVEPGYLPPVIDLLAFSLEPGKLSDIVQSKFGYHLIQVLDRKPAGTIPAYESQKEFLGKYLQEKLVKKNIDENIKSLKEGAEIEVLLTSMQDETKQAQNSDVAPKTDQASSTATP